MAKNRIGNQNPTQSLILPYEKTKYKNAIELYRKTGRTPQKWQIDLTKHIYAENDDNLWVHTKFGFSLPRRNGKNEVVVIREMQGLQDGEQILHTAHRTTTSHTAWERLCRLLDSAGIKYESLRATGRERVEIAETGGRVEFRTRTTLGGLGEGFDLIVIDEAQEYTEDQQSALKYTVSDSDNPQTIFCGTPPTPLSSGTVFVDLRNAALQSSTTNTGWAEWGVENESDVHDRELWYKTNPSLGTVLSERAVADEVGTDDIDFNIQRLGLWLKYNQKSAITATEWEELKVTRDIALTGKLYVGIKYGKDGTNVAMSIACRTRTGLVFVEAIDCQSIRNGNQWIINFLKEADVGKVAIDGASYQNVLAADMKDFGLDEPILPTVKEIVVANSVFEQAIYQQTLCHTDQPSLTEIITNCEKRNIGSNGGFGYKSQLEEHDVALMDSVLLAHWACSEARPTIKQKIRY